MTICTIAMCIMLNSFGQKCVKFINYQTKTVNTKGISMQLPGGLSSVSLGETSVSTLQRVASDQLQKLDLLQYNICAQLGNIKNDFIREKLQTQYTNLLMKMMNLLKAEEKNNVSEESTPEPAQVAQQPIKPRGESTAITSDFSKMEETMAQPTPTSQRNEQPVAPVSTGNTPIVTPTQSMDEDIEVDISFPCGDYSLSSKGIIRAFGMESSMDVQIAKRVARTVALEELASKIEITVKTVAQDYSLRTQKNLDEKIEKRFENMTQTSVNKTLSGYTTACEKFTQNKSTKKYSCYIALEISEENVLKPLYQELKQDETLKEALPSYEKFKDTFNEVMNTYEKSF